MLMPFSRAYLPIGSRALQAGGHRFDPGWLHWKALQIGLFGDSGERREQVGTKQNERPGRGRTNQTVCFVSGLPGGAVVKLD
jgi:hypothetical protein